MMIDKISGVNPLNNLQNTKRTNNVSTVNTSSDEISISNEAKALADAYYLDKVAKETPDVRENLVEAVKQKIQDPNYLNDATIAATADQILSAFGL